MLFYKERKEIISNGRKICFSGHRPNKLLWGYDENATSCERFKIFMYEKLEYAILKGYTYFISGMALGIDMICAEIVLNLKKKYPYIVLECAIPCLNQSQCWTYASKKRYKKILLKADYVNFISKNRYSKSCMLNRNLYMVQNCDIVIAVWNGTKSGTANTINLAKKHGKKVIIVSPNNFN